MNEKTEYNMDDFSYFRLRIPNDLKQLIEKKAKENNRSINAEILYVLTKHYEPTIYAVDNLSPLEKILKQIKILEQLTVEIKENTFDKK